MAGDVDVAVVGAGAAGIGAAMTLGALGLKVAVLEARTRAGGRGHTVCIDGDPADLGCEWLHEAERNPWRAIAEEAGWAIDGREPDWTDRFGIHQLSGPDRMDLGRAFGRFWSAIDEAAERGDRGAPDLPVAAVLPRDEGRWRPAFDAVTSFLSGAGIAEMSAVDAGRYDGEGANWRPVAGYGGLIASRAVGLPVTYGTPVEAIDLTGPRVALTTPRGRVEAQAVVLTASVGVLRSGAVRLSPALPDGTASALDGLAMGHVAKLFLRVEGRPWGDLGSDAMVLGSFGQARTGSYTLGPMGRPLVQGYFGGDLARDLEAAGLEATAAFAIDELAGIFGTAVRRCLRPAVVSTWSRDPLALGAYSYARPGGANGRSALAVPVLDRLFIAGEACSRAAYGTAHGALTSGVEAARAAAATLGSAGRPPGG
jgi:monoamine oxidase